MERHFHILLSSRKERGRQQGKAPLGPSTAPLTAQRALSSGLRGRGTGRGGAGTTLLFLGNSFPPTRVLLSVRKWSLRPQKSSSCDQTCLKRHLVWGGGFLRIPPSLQPRPLLPVKAGRGRELGQEVIGQKQPHVRKMGSGGGLWSVFPWGREGFPLYFQVAELKSRGRGWGGQCSSCGEANRRWGGSAHPSRGLGWLQALGRGPGACRGSPSVGVR